MRGILPVLTLALLSVACGGPAPQSDSSGAHLAHEAYVTAVNSNNLHMPAWGSDARRGFPVGSRAGRI